MCLSCLLCFFVVCCVSLLFVVFPYCLLCFLVVCCVSLLFVGFLCCVSLLFVVFIFCCSCDYLYFCLGAQKIGKICAQTQGPMGRSFQLRDGSGSGISTAFLSIGYYRVLKILIGYFPDKVLSFGSTKVLAALEPLDPSTRLARIYVGFNAILGCCSRRAEQIKEAAQKSD